MDAFLWMKDGVPLRKRIAAVRGMHRGKSLKRAPSISNCSVRAKWLRISASDLKSLFHE